MKTFKEFLAETACKTCQGDGVLDAVECKACNGTGAVLPYKTASNLGFPANKKYTKAMNEDVTQFPNKQFLIEKATKARSAYERLKKNKKPLTDEERELVMKRKAVWHHGLNGEESPAVWKSVDKSGKTTYITATHRAYNTATTVKGAIKRYHDFIKGTA